MAFLQLAGQGKSGLSLGWEYDGATNQCLAIRLNGKAPVTIKHRGAHSSKELTYDERSEDAEIKGDTRLIDLSGLPRGKQQFMREVVDEFSGETIVVPPEGFSHRVEFI